MPKPNQQQAGLTDAEMDQPVTIATAPPQEPAAPVSAIQQRWQRTLPGNRFAGLIEAIHFVPSDSSKTYTNDDGSKQRKMASAIIVLRGGFAALNASVNAKQTPGGKKYAEFAFVSNRTVGKSLKALDERGNVELNALCDDLAAYYVEYRKATGIKDAAPRGAVLDDDVTLG